MKKIKEYVLLDIGLLWLVLFWEGDRFLPGAKQFSETIPLWAVILNLIILLITFTLIRNKKEFSLVDWVVTIVGCTISSIIWSITCRHFPFISFAGAGAILLISQFLKKEGSKKEEQNKRL
jgi:cytochrome bd-type quinol oxidase subunit 2